jgi:hypothetical protein
MKILTSSYTLDLAGVPTFTKTFFDEVKKRDDEIKVFSPLGGRLESEMEVIKDLKTSDFVPDVIISQHNSCSEILKDNFPTIPHIFYSHGLLPEIEQPPTFICDFYFAINSEVENNLVTKGVDKNKIAIIRDFIDLEKFKSTKKINEKLKNVLFISNYKKWKNFKIVTEACKINNLNLKCVGAPYGRSKDIAKDINESDLVISWGRGVLEAMASERCTISFDKTVGDGYIDSDNYLEARENNFSGRINNINFSPTSLALEMLKYNPKDGVKNRDLIEKYHNPKIEVDKITDVIQITLGK